MKGFSLFSINLSKISLLLVFVFILAACNEKETSPPTTSNYSSGDAYPYPAPPAKENTLIQAYPGQSEEEIADNTPLLVKEDEWPLFPGKLLFHSERTGQLSIFSLDGSDGSISRITEGSTRTFEPALSPDCQSIVYTAGLGTGEDSELFTMPINGGRASKLFDSPNLLEWGATWSPDGKTIAYQNNKDALINICFVNLDTGEQSCLERQNYSNATAEWSPDGTQILFSSNRDGDWEIYATNLENISAPPIQLTDNNYTDLRPRFSPDGQSIVYDASPGGQFDVFIMNAGGTNQRQLTTDPTDDRSPRFVGKDWIAFTSYRTTDGDIYLIRTDGSELKRITDAIGMDDGAAWCPIP